jgi:hypothetical protein
VVAVLLGRTEGDDDRVAPALELRRDLRPGELVQFERADARTLTAFASLAGGEGSWIWR